MTGFEPVYSDIQIDRVVKCATTTLLTSLLWLVKSLKKIKYQPELLDLDSQIKPSPVTNIINMSQS